MVLPITGPVTKTDYLYYPPPHSSTIRYIERWDRYRQKKPFDLRLPYEHKVSISRNVSLPTPLDAGNILTVSSIDSTSINWAKMKAWDKFTESASEQAQLGETLAEMRQSETMIVGRVLQLARFAKHLKRLEFQKARDALELPRKQTKDVWSRDKTTAKMFLEVHFGWEPLIKDMYNAMDVLCRDLGYRVAKGRATEYNKYATGVGVPYSPVIRRTYRSRVQYMADIRVTNPNLALMSALGLTNPLGTAWALVPWSFVFDWFTNFSACLEGYNRFMGLTIINPSTSVRSTLAYTSVWNNYGWSGSVATETFRRDPTLRIPTFGLRPFKGWSLTRGITAMSLLITQIPPRREAVAFKPRREPVFLPPKYKWED